MLTLNTVILRGRVCTLVLSLKFACFLYGIHVHVYSPLGASWLQRVAFLTLLDLLMGSLTSSIVSATSGSAVSSLGDVVTEKCLCGFSVH